MAKGIVIILAMLFCGWLVSAQAEDYLDDRSTAESLVRSLYNAINAHDYARAYDYFAEPPAKDFAAYQQGFENTKHVDVLTGTVSGDGAAGSTFFSLPVAIRAKDSQGTLNYFAGCYTIKAINGPIQQPPSRPYQIFKASMKPIKAGDYERYSLPKCGDAPAAPPAEEASVESVKAQFVADMKGQCDKTADTQAGFNEPEVHTLTYHAEGAAPSDPDNKVKLFVFVCMMAAYNETEVFYLDDHVLGPYRVSFAQPHLVITYPDGDEEQKTLKSLKVDGFSATDQLTNAGFDAKTNMITDFSKWRGVGDASSSGTWVFKQGQFVLKSYDVDPTYDGEQNPITVMDDGRIKPQF